jgi:hypothetical protein
MLSREFTSTTPVREQVMSAYTVGNAETTADISIGLQPNLGQAVFDIRLQGRSDVNDTVAYSGPVRVYGSSTTTIDARKQLILGNTGLTVRPASAICRTSLQIHDVAANRRFVERIGWRRANRMRPQATGVTSQRVARRVEAQLDREVNTAVDEARSSLAIDLGDVFADGLVQATLHATCARNGDQKLDGPFDIAVAYRLIISAEGPHLVRVSGPTIQQDESAASTGNREECATFLRRKFEAVFPRELFFDGLQPPTGGSWGKLRRYLLTQLSAENGWFAIGYQDRDES